MTRDEICIRVRAVVDSLVESRTDGVSLIGDQGNLDMVIVDKIPYALMWVLQNASADMLDDTSKVFDISELELEDIIRDGDVWKVKLPTHVLRVLTARLSTWMKSPEPVSESTPEALMQADEWARGSWDRPVVVVRRNGGSLWLELYSGRGTETDEDILVSIIDNPELADDEDADIPVPVKTEAAFIYYVAALTMTAFRESIAPSLFEIAGRHLGITQQEGQ